MAVVLARSAVAEAPKHIGEKATVVGKVECIDAGRTFHCLTLDGCLSNSPFWIIVNDDASGPDLNIQDLKGVTIAVTGQIEKRDAYSHPWMVVKSTTQIQTRAPLNTDHISRGHEKESKGDLDGAIAEFTQAIEHQPDRRAEAYEFRGRAKERKGDWNGALADYDGLVALDSNKAAPYYIRATQKKQHGDFAGAMVDFSRAAELRSSGISFVEIGKMRKANGDSAGAMAEYDKAIAMLDSQIAGTQKASDSLDLLYYHRGYAKELKGDVDGAVSDYSQAIAIRPSYEACAYSRRGDIKKARGDLAGAISDYEFAVKYAQLPEDKDKLKKVRAEAKTQAKSVAAQSNTRAMQSTESPNNREVTPDSIAEAFVQAYSGTDVDAAVGLYGDRVDYTNSGVISNAALRKQAQEYFTRWPVRQWSLVGSVSYIPIGSSREKIVFSANYDASDPQTKKHASGAAKETLIVAADRNGDLKIVSQKEQISKRSSGQVGDGTSQEPGFNVANQPDANAFAQGQSDSPECKADAKGNWSEASPDKKLLATIHFVPNPDQHWRAFDDLKASVFRCTPDGKRGQLVASTSIGSLVLQCAHWSPDSRFLLFTTSPSRGGHGGWHYRTFVYCARDHRFTDDLEDVLGNVLASDFSFESPDIAVLTVSDDQAPSTAGEESPTKQVKVSLGKVVDKLDRLP